MEKYQFWHAVSVYRARQRGMHVYTTVGTRVVGGTWVMVVGGVVLGTGGGTWYWVLGVVPHWLGLTALSHTGLASLPCPTLA